MTHTPKLLSCTLILFFGLLLPAIGTAQQKPTSEDSGEVAAAENGTTTDRIEIVLRFSKGLFESLTKQDIEMTLPINRTMEGIRVNGTASGKGTTDIELNALEGRAEFIVKVPGTADASFSGDAGPATAHSTAVVAFDSCKRIEFDGTKFYQGATGTSASARTCVNQICPRRKGPIGRVVTRIGWCIAKNNIGEINKVVEEVANEILADTFDERATELLDSLNDITKALDETRLQKTIDKYFPEAKSYIYHLRTVPDSILAGVGGPNAKFPELPPAKAHVELWLKTRPLEAAFLEMLVDWNVAHDVLKEFLPEDEAKLIADDLVVETIDGWSVLRIGIKKKEAATDEKEESEKE